MNDKQPINDGEVDKSKILGFYSNYWGSFIDMLLRIANLKEERARVAREELYDMIREKSGLEFAGWGDQPNRWLNWMIANDTMDSEKAWATRDENLRRRAEEKTRP